METYKVTVDEEGTIRWYNADGKLHRLNGPVVERMDGSKEYYKNGKLHREDGPAIEYLDGRPASEGQDAVKNIKFPSDDHQNETNSNDNQAAIEIHLLYRPGHYDILYTSPVSSSSTSSSSTN